MKVRFLSVFLALGLGVASSQNANATLIPVGDVIDGLTHLKVSWYVDSEGTGQASHNGDDWKVTLKAGPANDQFNSTEFEIFNGYHISNPPPHDGEAINVGVAQIDPLKMSFPAAASTVFDTIPHLPDHKDVWSMSGEWKVPSGGGTVNRLHITVEARHISEPTTLALMGLGLAGIGYRRRRLAA